MDRRLTERRKADRAEMVRHVFDIAARHGATAEVETLLGEEIVTVKADRGLCASVSFDGKSPQPDVFVVSWFVWGSPARITDTFAPSVNTYHRQKATDIAEGFPALAAILATRLHSIRTGAAFVPEAEG